MATCEHSMILLHPTIYTEIEYNHDKYKYKTQTSTIHWNDFLCRLDSYIEIKLNFSCFLMTASTYIHVQFFYFIWIIYKMIYGVEFMTSKDQSDEPDFNARIAFISNPKKGREKSYWTKKIFVRSYSCYTIRPISLYDIWIWSKDSNFSQQMHTVISFQFQFLSLQI